MLIIASMIEREAQVAKDRRLIAAVIYNRLKQGMPLGIDATIRYATNNWSTAADANPSSRRTRPSTRARARACRRRRSATPGLASIEAAARPANVDYLYYVVKPGHLRGARLLVDLRRVPAGRGALQPARARRNGQSPTNC